LTIDWTGETLPEPAFTGRRLLAGVPLETLIPYIDWTFFFAAWELKGRFPAIFDHPQYGAAARDLYDNARALLDRIVSEKLLTASAVYGFWPAASEGDDLVVFSDREHSGELARFNMLRQQEAIADRKPNLSLADFVAPRDSGRADYLGAFAVTAGLGADDLAHRFERDNDDYNAILVKAIADRLAEACAAFLHARARAEWGIDGNASPDEIIAETHRGIRPGFGYPACPDHSEKFKLFDLLDARSAGLDLTESAAMTPAASVSGLYFAHPQARYFTVGRIGEDQIASYARRKGQSIEQVERWLTTNLSYEPARC
jgi:5-methyltetrahydrofolate--homocysteine methyltransferase